MDLANCTAQNHPCVKEVLDFIREDLRSLNCEYNINETNHGLWKKFSEWCAVIDYFEIHLNSSGNNVSEQQNVHWAIWCGTVETQFGNLESYVTSPHWSVEAPHQFFRILEMVGNFSLTRPNVASINHEIQCLPFGTLAGLTAQDSHVYKVIGCSLECDDFEIAESSSSIWQTHLQYSYREDPPLKCCVHSYPGWALGGEFYPEEIHRPPWLNENDNLCCYWNVDEEECDWDDAFNKLGENVIRIMKRFSDGRLSDSFYDAWNENKTLYHLKLLS